MTILFGAATVVGGEVWIAATVGAPTVEGAVEEVDMAEWGVSIISG
jgi:hypothetical protein